MKRKTPLRRASKKRARELRVYSTLRKSLLQNAFCEFPDCISRANQIHHIAGRSGANLIDTKNLMLICIEHHAWIHDHAKEARKRGLLK